MRVMGTCTHLGVVLRHVEAALLHDVGIVGEVHVDVEPLVRRLRRHRPAEGMWQAYVSARWRRGAGGSCAGVGGPARAPRRFDGMLKNKIRPF